MTFLERSLNLLISTTSLSIFIILVLIMEMQFVSGNSLNEIEPFGLDTDQVLMASLESPEQQQQQQQQHQIQQDQQSSHIQQQSGLNSRNHMGEKRSWQRLQGSWGKRDFNNIDDYETNQLNGIDEIPEYDDSNYNTIKYAILLRNAGVGQQSDQFYTNEQKRAWKAMNGAWGKRLSGSGDWNKFRGSWGKRETGWNNLKGLWGKRSAQWDKLNSAWGRKK